MIARIRRLLALRRYRRELPVRCAVHKAIREARSKAARKGSQTRKGRGS